MADVVDVQPLGAAALFESVDVDPVGDLLDQRAHRTGGVLEQHLVPGAQRPLVEVADGRLDVLGGRGSRPCGDQVAARDVEVVGEPDGDRLRGPREVRLPAERVDAGHGAGEPGGQDGDRVSDAQYAGGQLARVAAVVGVLLGLRADHVLDREAGRLGARVAADRHRLQVLQQGRAAVPVHVRGGLDDVVPGQGGDRDRQHVAHAE